MATDVLLIIAVLVVGYLFASVLYPMLLGGAGYTPAPREEVAEAIRMGGLRRDGVFYGRGAGPARLSSRLWPFVATSGMEIEPLRWLIGSTRAKGARVVLGNLLAQDISDAGVVFVFQYRGRVNDRVAAKIKESTRPGTRVISYGHRMDALKLVDSKGELFICTT